MMVKLAGLKPLYKTCEMMLVMFGAIAGVGFVAGTEIEDFFARFGINFIFGIIMLFLLMVVLVYKILSNDMTLQKSSILYNNKQNVLNNTFLIKNRIKNCILFFNLFMISSAMFSGLRVMLLYLLKNNYLLIYIVSILIVFAMLIFGIKGLAKFNYLVVIFLGFVLAIVAVSLSKNFEVGAVRFNLKNSFGAMLFAGIYVFMNIVELEPIAKEYGLFLSKGKRLLFAFIFSLLLSFVVFIICMFLRNNSVVASYNMPMLVYFSELGLGFKLVFSVGLVMSLLSTLLTCLIGVKSRVGNMLTINNSNIASSFLAVMMSVVVGVLPFSFFTKIIYPVIGVLNFIVFVFL